MELVGAKSRSPAQHEWSNGTFLSSQPYIYQLDVGLVESDKGRL